MSRLVAALGCVTVSAAVLIAGAPTALADDASFVRDARALGFLISGVNLLSTGHSACYFLTRNRDPDEVAARIMRYGNVELNVAKEFLARSVTEYCPQFGDRLPA